MDCYTDKLILKLEGAFFCLFVFLNSVKKVV